MKISTLAHPVLFFICYEALLQEGFVQRPTKYQIPTGYIMCITLRTFSCTFQPAEMNTNTFQGGQEMFSNRNHTT